MEVEDLSLGVVPVRLVDGRFEVLLCKSARYGYYLFPKGHPDPGETKIQSAERELLEETGHRAVLFWTGSGWSSQSSDACELPILSYYYQSKSSRVHKSVIFYMAQVEPISAIQDTDEIESVAWFPADHSTSPLLQHNENISHFTSQILPLLSQNLNP